MVSEQINIIFNLILAPITTGLATSGGRGVAGTLQYTPPLSNQSESTMQIKHK